MSRASIDTSDVDIPIRDLEGLRRTLELLVAVNEQPGPDVIDSLSYSAGYRSGARAAYADVAQRLRELIAGGAE